MPHAGLDPVIAAEEILKRFGFRWRFDDDKCFRHTTASIPSACLGAVPTASMSRQYVKAAPASLFYRRTGRRNASHVTTAYVTPAHARCQGHGRKLSTGLAPPANELMPCHA